MERRPDVGPHPAADRDPDGFEVLWAAEPGPLPEDVSRDLRDIADTIEPVLGDDDDGVIGTRFGQRSIVAPAGSPSDAVDVADVDVPRSLVLTMGGKDPTPAGALLARVLAFRNDILYGYAHAPDIDGPSMDVLQKIMPILGGGTVAEVEGVGVIALGRTPNEVRGGIEAIQEADDGEDEDGGHDLDPSDLTNEV